MENMEFEVNFTDLTMLEANGEFDEVHTLMMEDQEIIGGIKSPVQSDKWCVKSNVTILHALGFSTITCDFYHDKKVVIVGYQPSAKDLYCIDIRCLSAWAQAYGWKRPEPLPHIVDAQKDFWVIQWETHVVDSDYLTSKKGERGVDMFASELHEDADDDEAIDRIIVDNDDGNLDKYR